MRDGWTETTLGAHIKIVMGQAPPGKDCNKDGFGIPFVKAGEFTDGFPLVREWTTNPLRFSKLGDTLICVVGATCGKLSKGIDCAIGRSVAALQPLETLDGGFLWNFMARKVQEMRDGSRGSAQGVITKDDLADLPLGLPPLVEQKRIVDVVSSVDAYINALQQQADTARTARNAVLHELLSAGGDDWTETTLGEVAEASWGNTTVTKKQYKESGFTAFSASGPDGFVDWFEHDGEGVVLSAIGALCGKTWLADGKWTPIKNTIWIKSISEDCLTKYLFLISKMPDLWPIRGQAQPFISLGDVRQVAALIPPLTEQKRIVDVVSSMDEVIQSTEKAVVDTKNLRSGLLSDLLSGEHEIPESYDRLLGAA